MESSAEAAAAAADTPTRTFSQVVFTDIPHSYLPATPITCSYTLNAAFQPNPRDWVGIFKVGWSTTKDYHTFVWVEPGLDVVGQQSVTRQALFKEYYLPKDEIEFYQFCYVDSSGQVRGASTPFCFRSPVEQSMESSPDDDLLVITTQEQLEQSGREKAELQKELDQKMEENESLRRALEEKQRECDGFKAQNEEKEKENSRVKEENENLKGTLEQQVKEMDNLKEMLAQMKKQMEEQAAAEQSKMTQSASLDEASRQSETQAQEKYNRAVMKINQLKEEREELRRKVDAQCDEISTLNSKIREQERELFKTKDSIQLLQVDLQSSEKEKARLSAELQRLQSFVHDVDNMKRENQELCRRLSEQETVQSCQDDDLRARCQTLVRQLQDAQEKLAAEREESKNIKRRNEFLDREMQDVREQLERQIISYDEAQRRCGKQELLLREAHESIADKIATIEENEHMMRLLNQEKERLVKDYEDLGGECEGLRKAYADLQATLSATHMQPGSASPAGNTPSIPEWQQQETPEQSANLYENIPVGGVEEPEEQVEEALVCRHCQESFPFITRQQLEQHEQSHRVCPFCTMICDNMEQSVFEDHVYGHEL